MELTVSLGGGTTGTLNDLTSAFTLGALNPGEEKKVHISWRLPEGAGNEVQGDRVSFNIEFILEQA